MAFYNLSRIWWYAIAESHYIQAIVTRAWNYNAIEVEKMCNLTNLLGSGIFANAITVRKTSKLPNINAEGLE